MALVDLYGNLPRVTFDLEEGNFTSATVLTMRGREKGGSFASELFEGANLQICTSADETLELASTGIKVGILLSDPIGPLPTSSKTSGNYVRRYGPVALFGDLVKLPVAADNAAISPGDYLAIDGSNKYAYDKEEDSGSQPTLFIALQTKSASSGGYVMAIKMAKGAAIEAD